jgi:hypothetical protein
LNEKQKYHKENYRTLLEASGEVGLEVNTEKTRCMMSEHESAGQSHNLLTANKSFENVVKFKYIGTRITIENFIHQEIKSRLHSGNACCHSVQSLLFSNLLSVNRNIKIYKIIISPILLKFGLPKKLVRLIKMCLNETYSKVRIGKFCPINFLLRMG